MLYEVITFTFQFVIYMLPVAMGTSYLFNYYLIPKFLFTKKIFWFVLLSIYALILSFYLISITIFPFLIISKNEVNFATLDKSLLDIYFLMVGMYTARITSYNVCYTKLLRRLLCTKCTKIGPNPGAICLCS